MNRYPELKSFLLEGEAESYQGVTVEFIKGRRSVMVLTDADDHEVDHINLQDYATKTELHELFQELGFQLKSEEEMEEMRRIKEENEAEEERKRLERLRLLKEQTAKRREERIKMHEERKKIEQESEPKIVSGRTSGEEDREDRRRKREQHRQERRRKKREEVDLLRAEGEKRQTVQTEL